MRKPALALILLLTACGNERQAPGANASDSAGVTIVSNELRRPGWAIADRWTLASNPSIQVGNIPGNAEHQLYHVAHSRRLADGGIVVANSGFGDVRIFDGKGFYVRTIDLGVDAADKAPPLRVWEPVPGQLLVYQGDGSLALYGTDQRPVRTRLERPAGLSAAPADTLEDMEPVGRFADNTLLFHARHPWDETATGIGRRKARLLRFGADGKLLGSVGDFDDNAVLFANHGAYIFAPTAAVATGDSTIWYGDGQHYELREMTRDGRLLRVVRLDKPGPPVLQADRAAYRSAVARQVQGTTRETTMAATLDSSVFADTFPVFDRIVVDDLGDVWVRNYQWFDLGSGKSWFVFDPEGRFLGEVTTPSILEIHQIGADFVLGRMADRNGREAVYIFRLQKPGAGPPAGGDAARPDGGAPRADSAAR